MELKKAVQIKNSLSSKGDLSHVILAHTSARYILFNVKEPPEEHPKFLPDLNFIADSLAFTYLEIGCSFAENGKYSNAKETLTKAAVLIEYNHLPIQNRNELSKYYILVASLAYYLSAEFSKAFIILRKIEQDTNLALIISFLLKRNFKEVFSRLNLILLDPEYLNIETENNIDDKIVTVLIARATANILEYIFTGDIIYIKNSDEIFKDILELSKNNFEPGLWWVVRLLKLALNTLIDNSLWNNLTNKLNPYNDDSNWELDQDVISLFPFLVEYSNKRIVENYINNLVHRDNPIVELFISQKNSLDKVLSKNGAVISLPTSSGKTRIAEIAILQSLIQNKSGKILYLAPFRSLAFEIERSFTETFVPLNYSVSHLYGGSQFSKLDQTLINEAHILIATPEKAKAILRASEEILEQIKLIVIDEGHLIDSSKRNVTNEIFIEELKYYISNNKGKIILLSAVLPNAADISEWITDKSENIISENWRPASQRMGLLEFTGKNVNIKWYNPENDQEISTFNNNFIDPFKIEGSDETFPTNKQDAVASAAVKFLEIGSVLIFVGGTRNVETTVFNYASSVKIAFNNNFDVVDWQDIPEWKEFKLICKETYGEKSKLLNYAQYGIICHHGKFPNAVRISLDRLLATKKARIIVSTTTLAQGVNIGISSVIFANVYISGKEISMNDFWNIAGRAGRAFIDTEGKILYAIDKTKKNWRYQVQLAEKYFDKNKLDDVESGFLQYLKLILDIAIKCNIDFDFLLQLISENDFTKFVNGDEDYSTSIKDFFDWTDDVFLTFELYSKNDNWIDTNFRKSLAYLQAKKTDENLTENIISILKARREAILKIVENPDKRKEYVVSGLPLMSIIKLDNEFEIVIKLTDDYLSSKRNIDDLIFLVKNVEKVVSGLPSSTFHNEFNEQDLNTIRADWFSGMKFNEIANKISNAQTIVNSYYGYTIPWVFNAIARQFYLKDIEDKGELFEELSVLSELGVPTFNAAKIYLTGIHSRIASIELSQILSDEIISENNRISLLHYLIRNRETIIKECTHDETIEWLNILDNLFLIKDKRVNKISDFKFENEKLTIKSNKMFIRNNANRYFFTSPIYDEIIDISVSKDFPFDTISNRDDIYFEFIEKTWVMRSRNPSLRIID